MAKKISLRYLAVTSGADLHVMHVALGLCHTHNETNSRLCYIEIMRPVKHKGRIKHKVYQPCCPVGFFLI